jgi:hypothetical protein
MDVTNSDIVCIPMANDGGYSSFVSPATNILAVSRNAGRSIGKPNIAKAIATLHNQAQHMQQQIKNVAYDVPTNIETSSIIGDKNNVEKKEITSNNLNPQKTTEMTPYIYAIGTLLLLIGYVIIYKASKKV